MKDDEDWSDFDVTATDEQVAAHREALKALKTGRAAEVKIEKPWEPTFGKMPTAWIKRLRGASGAVHDIAKFLLVKNLHVSKRGRPPRPLSLSNTEAKEIGISPDTRDRGLREMVARGLLSEEQQQRGATRYALKMMEPD